MFCHRDVWGASPAAAAAAGDTLAFWELDSELNV